VALLSREHDIDLIATVQRADEVVSAARALKPDVVLLAAAFPGHDGIDIARARAALRGIPLRDLGRACAMSSGHRGRSGIPGP
jgi:DNA-binding NarL/FixJ family response regulator